MAWAAALGSMVGSGSEGMASAAQYQASKHERNISVKKQLAMDLVRPSHVMEGLRRAGINPILAATQGMPASAHVGMATTGGSPSFDKDSVGRAISSAKQAKMMDSAVREQNARADREEELAKQAFYDTANKQLYSGSILKAELEVLQEQMLNLVAQRGLTSARSAESEQARLRIAVDRTLMQLGIPGARAMADLYERNPELKQLKESGFIGKMKILGDDMVERGAKWDPELRRRLKSKAKPGLGFRMREDY